MPTDKYEYGELYKNTIANILEHLESTRRRMELAGMSQSMYPSGHTNSGVADMMFLLDDWLDALEDGSINLRLPDPFYIRPNGKENWTEDDLDRIVKAIDAEIDMEVPRAPGTSVGAKAGTDFYRMTYEQRLAFAQALETFIESNREILYDYFPPVEMPIDPSVVRNEYDGC